MSVKNEPQKKVWYFLAWIPMFIMMSIIFGFSGQNGEQSGGLSEKIGTVIIEVIDQVSPLHFSDEKKGELVNQLQFPIRKTAHMMEYAVLFSTILLPVSIWNFGAVRWKNYFFSWMGAVVFACTDEFHQLFVPDRAGQIQDVCIDGIGAFIGAIVLWNVIKVLKNKK